MERKSTIVALLVCSMAIANSHVMAHGIDKCPKAVENWFEKLSHKKEISRLHFYFHDIASGNSPSACQVAWSSITTSSPTFFDRANKHFR